jgi:DNA polymerase epsilon subunit 1
VLDLGRTLELDTDGIWAALPGSFPEVRELLAESIS